MSAHFDPSPRAAYSINETASLLGVSRRIVYDLLSKGKLSAVRIGARQRIPATELERLVSQRTRSPDADAQLLTGKRQIRTEDAPAQPAISPSEPAALPTQSTRMKLSTLLAQVAEGSAAR